MVFDVVDKFLQRGTYFPGKPGWKERAVSISDVEFVEYSKLTKSSTGYTSEIREALRKEYARPPMLHLVQQ